MAGRLRDALVERLSGKSVFLPRLRALGDPDEEESSSDLSRIRESAGGQEEPESFSPAVSPLERQWILTRLALDYSRERRPPGGTSRAGFASAAQAARLARELARTMDAVENEGLDFSALRGVEPVGGDRSGEWDVTGDFLRFPRGPLVRHSNRAGPCFSGGLAQCVARSRRDALIFSPASCHSTIVAGSTGSLPGTAQLIEAVSLLVSRSRRFSRVGYVDGRGELASFRRRAGFSDASAKPFGPSFAAARRAQKRRARNSVQPPIGPVSCEPQLFSEAAHPGFAPPAGERNGGSNRRKGNRREFTTV